MVPPFTQTVQQRASLLLVALGIMAGILGMHALAGGNLLPGPGHAMPASAAGSPAVHDGGPPASVVALPNVRHQGASLDRSPMCTPSGHDGHASEHGGCDPAPPAPGPQLHAPADRSGFVPVRAPDAPSWPAATGRIPAAPTLEQLSVRRT